LTLFEPPAETPVERDHCILDILLGKSSDYPKMMNLDDAREIINASAFATWKKQPHLVNVTIRWEMMANFVLRDWMNHQTIFFEKMRKWLVRTGIPVGFIWGREMGQRLGAHTHLLLHLPVEHWGDLKQFLLDAGQFGESNQTGEAIRFSGGEYGTKDVYRRAGHLRYLLKSLDPAIMVRQPSDDGGTVPLMASLGVDSRDQTRLPIPGKRCGTSHTWGPGARRAAGWRELMTPKELRLLLPPR
jgi:hypothetical protein